MAHRNPAPRIGTSAALAIALAGPTAVPAQAARAEVQTMTIGLCPVMQHASHGY